MTTRGVLYVAWGRAGNAALEAMFARSLASLRRFHPGMAHHVVDLPAGSTLLDKARMYGMSPFEETLFLDLDTVVMGDLTFGFERAQEHGLACSICEAPWARRFQSSVWGDVVEYNTGVLFFRKRPDVEAVFARWAELAPTMDSSLEFLDENDQPCRMPLNDQASFAMAVHERKFNPYVLPLNWNFRAQFVHEWFGPLKVWHAHEPPPPQLLKLNEMQSAAGARMGFFAMPKP
jgi:hypothetical protein